MKGIKFGLMFALLTACNPLVNKSHVDSTFVTTAVPTPFPTATPVQGAPLLVQSASVSSSSTTIVVTVADNGFAPVMPATGITGFTLQVDGTPVAVSSGVRTGSMEMTLTPAAPIASNSVVTLAYSGGNVTDSSVLVDALQPAASISLTNNSAFEKDALSYFSAITLAGGTVSSTTKTHVQTLISALKASGVWTKLIEIYPFAGDNFAASFVKLKKKSGTPSALTTGSFIAADYAETGSLGGLKGNLSSLPVDTGLSTVSLTQTSLSIGAYVNVDSTMSTSIGCYIGSSYSAT